MITYDIQYGGEAHDKYEIIGSTDFDNFLSVVDDFNWINEMEKSNAHTEGSSPTISLQNTSDQTALWISIAGDRINYGDLLGYSYPRTIKSWFGMGKTKIIYWLEIYLTMDMLKIKYYLQLYFSGYYDQLYVELKRLPKFKEMETSWKKEN